MTTNQLVSDLRAARRLVKRGWTRNAWARSRDGRAVHQFSRVAVRFSLSGAIYRVTTYPPSSGQDCYSVLIKAIGCRSEGLANWNDRQKSKRPVLAAFDRAIVMQGTTENERRRST